jgi:riboflavin kinase / FMN adenylyltransferase
MEVLENFGLNNPLESSVLTIGSYDGIHRGHHEIIKSLVSHSKILDIKSVVITFNPHPRHVLNKRNEDFSILMSLKIKLETFKHLGIDKVYVIPFNKKFSKKSAKDFLDETIIPFFNPKYIVTGEDHHFGKDRSGSTNFLKKYCLKKGILLKVIKLVNDNGKKISSTNIRKLISNGFIRRANYELGSIYGFEGKVIHGKGRGRDLNFPTANISPHESKQLMPKPGVYLIVARNNGLFMYGMCNFGSRPTFKENKLVLEIHLFKEKLDDLYDQDLRVEFLERIRDEIKFPSSKELILQLENDKKKCLELKAKYN